MKYVKDKDWLLEKLEDKNVRIVDCRFSLTEPKKGKQDYVEGHISGAVYFDLEQDLSGTVGEHGGRHPLPNINQFVLKLETEGISNDTIVIAYDNGDTAFAARFWWLLQYLGHENVYVLNGGFQGWLEANYPVTIDIPTFRKEEFQVKINSDFIATIEEVRDLAEKMENNKILIDSRETKRYLGLEELIDKKAGHIPGAINKPWMDGLRRRQFITIEEQKQRFMDLDSDKQIIVYCGSGVTAVPNFLSLKEAGFDKVKLYVGSFSDWISYDENPIE